MAHEIDMSNGKANMAFTGQVPWHGLGKALPEGASIEEWQEAAGMTWTAVPVIPEYEWEGKRRQIQTHRTLVRSDTGVPLSVVSDDYHPVQPGQILEFFREMVEGSAFTIETAGCLRGGRKVWALAKATDELRLGKEDRIGRYALLATSYDKTMANIFQQTSVRVVCQNTLSMANARGESGSEKQIKFSHLQKFNAADLKVQASLETGWEAFCEQAAKLAAKKVTSAEAAQFFLDVYYPPSFRENSKRFFEKGAERQVNRMLEIMDGAPGQELKSARNTAWGLVNAVTYHVDHEIKSLNQDLRLDKAWFGQGADIKRRAFDQALREFTLTEVAAN